MLYRTWSEVLLSWRHWNNDWKESVGLDSTICLCLASLHIACAASDCHRSPLTDWEEKLESETFLLALFTIENDMRCQSTLKEMKTWVMVSSFLVNIALFWTYRGNVIKWFGDARYTVRKHMDQQLPVRFTRANFHLGLLDLNTEE